MKKSVIALLISACMFIAGCTTQTTAVVTLESISLAASTAIPTIIALQAAGKISEQNATLALNYAKLVSVATSETSVELKSSDSDAVKVDKITNYFAPLVAPYIGVDSPEASAAIDAISSSVTLFLSELKTGKVTMLSTIRGETVLDLKISMKDRHILSQIKTVADACVVKVNSWTPAHIILNNFNN